MVAADVAGPGAGPRPTAHRFDSFPASCPICLRTANQKKKKLVKVLFGVSNPKENRSLAPSFRKKFQLLNSKVLPFAERPRFKTTKTNV